MFVEGFEPILAVFGLGVEKWFRFDVLLGWKGLLLRSFLYLFRRVVGRYWLISMQWGITMLLVTYVGKIIVRINAVLAPATQSWLSMRVILALIFLLDSPPLYSFGNTKIICLYFILLNLTTSLMMRFMLFVMGGYFFETVGSHPLGHTASPILIRIPTLLMPSMLPLVFLQNVAPSFELLRLIVLPIAKIFASDCIHAQLIYIPACFVSALALLQWLSLFDQRIN